MHISKRKEDKMNKEDYTKDQIDRVLHNQKLILDLSAPHLPNLTMEMIYTAANDSMCRLEGITHYKED